MHVLRSYIRYVAAVTSYVTSSQWRCNSRSPQCPHTWRHHIVTLPLPPQWRHTWRYHIDVILDVTARIRHARRHRSCMCWFTAPTEGRIDLSLGSREPANTAVTSYVRCTTYYCILLFNVTFLHTLVFLCRTMLNTGLARFISFHLALMFYCLLCRPCSNSHVTRVFHNDSCKRNVDKALFMSIWTLRRRQFVILNVNKTLSFIILSFSGTRLYFNWSIYAYCVGPSIISFHVVIVLNGCYCHILLILEVYLLFSDTTKLRASAILHP